MDKMTKKALQTLQALSSSSGADVGESSDGLVGRRRLRTPCSALMHRLHAAQIFSQGSRAVLYGLPLFSFGCLRHFATSPGDFMQTVAKFLVAPASGFCDPFSPWRRSACPSGKTGITELPASGFVLPWSTLTEEILGGFAFPGMVMLHQIVRWTR